MNGFERILNALGRVRFFHVLGFDRLFSLQYGIFFFAPLINKNNPPKSRFHWNQQKQSKAQHNLFSALISALVFWTNVLSSCFRIVFNWSQKSLGGRKTTSVGMHNLVATQHPNHLLIRSTGPLPNLWFVLRMGGFIYLLVTACIPKPSWKWQCFFPLCLYLGYVYIVVYTAVNSSYIRCPPDWYVYCTIGRDVGKSASIASNG